MFGYNNKDLMVRGEGDGRAKDNNTSDSDVGTPASEIDKYNDKINYTVLCGYICTIFTKPGHTLDDVLECKKYVRKNINEQMVFRPSVDVRS